MRAFLAMRSREGGSGPSGAPYVAIVPYGARTAPSVSRLAEIATSTIRSTPSGAHAFRAATTSSSR